MSARRAERARASRVAAPVTRAHAPASPAALGARAVVRTGLTSWRSSVNCRASCIIIGERAVTGSAVVKRLGLRVR